jgi:hypothetical protein
MQGQYATTKRYTSSDLSITYIVVWITNNNQLDSIKYIVKTKKSISILNAQDSFNKYFESSTECILKKEGRFMINSNGMGVLLISAIENDN